MINHTHLIELAQQRDCDGLATLAKTTDISHVRQAAFWACKYHHAEIVGVLAPLAGGDDTFLAECVRAVWRSHMNPMVRFTPNAAVFERFNQVVQQCLNHVPLRSLPIMFLDHFAGRMNKAAACALTPILLPYVDTVVDANNFRVATNILWRSIVEDRDFAMVDALASQCLITGDILGRVCTDTAFCRHVIGRMREKDYEHVLARLHDLDDGGSLKNGWTDLVDALNAQMADTQRKRIQEGIKDNVKDNENTPRRARI